MAKWTVLLDGEYWDMRLLRNGQPAGLHTARLEAEGPCCGYGAVEVMAIADETVEAAIVPFFTRAVGGCPERHGKLTLYPVADLDPSAPTEPQPEPGDEVDIVFRYRIGEAGQWGKKPLEGEE